MIRLTRLNGKQLIVNCELIKFIEATPDTVITLTQGDKLMVRESVDEVIRATVEYRQMLNQSLAPQRGESLKEHAKEHGG